MLSFRNLSIRRKQTLIIMLTSSVALLLACVAFAAYEVITFRKAMVQNLSTLAEIVGNNTSASLDFNDPQSATETLSALQAEPAVIGVCIYTRTGDAFARYDRANDHITFTPPIVRPEGYTFERQRLTLARPIDHKGETIGSIYLESDMKALYARLTRYAGIVGLVFVASLLIALAMSSRLQRLISDPILHLAQVTRTVALEKTYSVRATRQSGDELGQLIDGFNEMLDQIQQRGEALQAAREHLEQRVVERTNELANSLSLLNATLDATADGILALDPEGRTVCFNRNFAGLWGFSAELFPKERTKEMFAFCSIQTSNPEQFLQRLEAIKAAPETEAFDVIEFKDGRTVERFIKPQWIGKQCVGNVVSLRDVTERKRAEEALRESQALYHSLVEQLPVGVFRKDALGRYVFVNPWFCRLKKAKAEQFLGKTPLELAASELAEPEANKPQIARLASQGVDHHQLIMRTGEQIELEEHYAEQGKTLCLHVLKSPVFDSSGAIVGSQGILIDITQRKEAETELEKVHRQLLDTSRQAGMAEVATSVLHNVGNVLNSINVSTTLAVGSIRKSKLNSLTRLAALVAEHQNDLAAFFTTDPKGAQLPHYLVQLAEHLANEQAALLKEVESTRQHVEHVKEIVMMQQNYARVCGVAEKVAATDLVEEALRMNIASLARHDIQVIRDYPAELSEINVERHKVLQILVNLIRNAKYACDEAGRKEKLLTVQVRPVVDGVQIAVTDNGVGIPAANLTRIFNHGFTTRKDGHGFGLHSGALSAKEMGGALTVHSDGPGTGATFILALPLQPPTSTLSHYQSGDADPSFPRI